MSPRDLPIWSRGAAAALMLIAAWHIPRTEQLVALVGSSSLEISAGVVAVAILLGMGLPLDLWPQHPARAQFSLGAALAASLVLGALMVVSAPTELPGSLVQTEKGLTFAVVVGSAIWSLAWGRLQHRFIIWWYGVATVAAVVPVAIGVLTIAVQNGGFPTVRMGSFLAVAAFFLVVGAAGALVTQELAFRRVLIGQAGDAGLATVLIAALLFGAWHAVAPDPPGGALHAAILGSLRGVVLGCLYSLSRSLLVPALYHGAWLATLRSFDMAAEWPEGVQTIEDSMTAVVVATAIVAILLAYQVSRRSGFVGILARRSE